MPGSQVSASIEDVGNIRFATDTADVTQDGGTNGGTLNLAVAEGSTQSYFLNAGSFSGTQYIGYGGTGKFVQTGGSDSGAIHLGYQAGTSGTYSISFGTVNGPL